MPGNGIRIFPVVVQVFRPLVGLDIFTGRDLGGAKRFRSAHFDGYLH